MKFMDGFMKDNHSFQDMMTWQKRRLRRSNHSMGHLRHMIREYFSEHLKTNIEKANRSVLLYLHHIFFFGNQGNYPKVQPKQR